MSIHLIQALEDAVVVTHELFLFPPRNDAKESVHQGFNDKQSRMSRVIEALMVELENQMDAPSPGDGELQAFENRTVLTKFAAATRTLTGYAKKPLHGSSGRDKRDRRAQEVRSTEQLRRGYRDLITHRLRRKAEKS